MLSLLEQTGDAISFTRINTHGYLLLRQWQPEVPTLELANRIGTVIDIERIAAAYRISNVQTLVPRGSEESSPHSYSGVYGLGEFPPHTDYAHWSIPPRFLMLRCLAGDPSVSTYLLSAACIADRTSRIIDRAIVAPRRKHPTQVLCPLAVRYRHGAQIGFRWDALFLRPFNQPAEALANVVSTLAEDKRIAITLSNPGDTLIIDNWRMLHGRSSVPPRARGRRIERIYMSTLWGLK
ncbi:TauD/TfdA family dioxygenase [Pseudomonas lijiangensis]|uniref:TauD/TfdA family dioxygenase n=1 Tax=Pseudomonas lijiangensis TaxID=2995658 RepID=UPI0034D79533